MMKMIMIIKTDNFIRMMIDNDCGGDDKHESKLILKISCLKIKILYSYALSNARYFQVAQEAFVSIYMDLAGMSGICCRSLIFSAVITRYAGHAKAEPGLCVGQ